MDKTPVLFYQAGTCSLGALISLLWLDQPFRLCRLEDGDNTNEDYLKLNALGEVPTLFLDGTVLTENVAILQHIGLKDLRRRITFEPGTEAFDQLQRALGFLSSDFHKSFMALFNGEVFHPDKKIQDEIKKMVIQGHLREVMDHAEIHLLRTPLMFDQPTVPDAYLYAMARWTADLYNLPKEFPHLVRFQKTMEKDPSVQLALKIESGEVMDATGSFEGHVDFKKFTKKAALRKAELDHLSWESDLKRAGVHAAVPNQKMPYLNI